MKVYRNRIRANNEWYEPEVRWQGGAMTDLALAVWVKNLKTKKSDLHINPKARLPH
jgi:hypothetical protein